jgi:uncharacterized damage-inducible protein DinB
MIDYFHRLYRYCAWANQRSLAALKANLAAQAEGLPLFAHVLAAEHLWLSRIEGRQAELAVWPTLSVEECERWAAGNIAGYAALLASLKPEDLARPVGYRNTAGEEHVTALGDILTQVYTHGCYHRGQIARAIGRTGEQAVNTDFIIFVRQGN